jgi:hypothetical protein
MLKIERKAILSRLRVKEAGRKESVGLVKANSATGEYMITIL